MKKISLCVALVLFFLYGIPSPVVSRTITIGYVEFPPMTYTDKQGLPAGVIIDIASKSLKKAGFKWAAKPLPAKRMARMLVNGDVQLWIGLSTLPEFIGKTHIGTSVVKKLSLRAYTIGKNRPILKPDDLKNQTSLILRGYSYGGWINFIKDPANQVNFIEFDSHEEAFKGLILFSKKNTGPCYLLNYKHPSQIVLNTKKIPDIQFNTISSFDIHFVVTRKMDDAKAALDKIETAFNQLKNQGALQ